MEVLCAEYFRRRDTANLFLLHVADQSVINDGGGMNDAADGRQRLGNFSEQELKEPRCR